ncbi:MAG: NYN domain-containing protein, partial [Butyrivibrio sp.]
ILPKAADPVAIFPKLKLLEEELPELNPEWDEAGRCINLRIMGAVQTEVLQKLILDRLGIVVEFGTGNIIYKETIQSRVEGVGHYEPLKHYAEVHLLLEPLKAGSGLIIASDCKEDILDRNWQRLIMTHLAEKTHRGVLTGSAITDMKITLMTGRAHVKHTEGGDFREATYRAVRQGLMNAESVLLEPVYEFELEILSRYMGRALTDIKRMNGSFNPPCTVGDTVIITGSAPAATIGNYNQELAAYSGGTGRIRCSLNGYEPCHNTEEVVAAIGYDAQNDTDNPSSSVFCANGTGFNVPWNEVPEYMHVESCLTDIEAGSPMEVKDPDAGIRYKRPRFSEEEYALGTKEVDAIIDSAGGANRSKRNSKWNYSGKGKGNTVNGKPLDRNPAPHRKLPGYILVDGYNVIFAWKELSRLAEANIDSARDRLLDILCNYQAIIKSELIVVFDAYRVKGHAVEYCDYHNIHVVYTAEAETADRYIERFAHENGRKYDVTVVTSDGQEQIIVIGQGCRLCSSREFEAEVTQAAVAHMEQYAQHSENSKVYMSEILQKNIDNLSSECNNSDIAE